MDRLHATAAAVDVEDAVSMPDGEVLVMPVREEHCGRVANDADGVRVRASAVRLHPAPDAGVAVHSRAPMHQVEFLLAHCQVQVVRQAGKEVQDFVALLVRPVVEQFPVGG